MHADTFDQGIARVLATFPNFEVPEITLVVWREMLEDLEDAGFLMAVRRLCLEHQDLYPGTNVVALIRSYALPDEAPIPADAWLEVMNGVTAIGAYGYPKWSHPRVDRAVKTIGWRNICHSEEIGVERAHFMDVYENLTQRDRSDRLAGILDLNTIKRMQDNGPRLLEGD